MKLTRKIQNFERHLVVKRGLCQITIDGYAKCIKKILRELGTETPTKRQWENYIFEISKHNYSYNHIVNTSLAIERYSEFIGKPIRLGRPRKPKRTIKSTLTEGEIAVMLAMTKNIREKAIMATLAYSGIRCKELCGLKVEDVDFIDNCLRIIRGKMCKDRVAYVSNDCLRVIDEYLKDYPRKAEEYLFTTLVHGYKYNGNALRKLLRTLARRGHIEKRVHPHILRHSLAVNMLNRGANILTIKNQLGHEFIETTMIYVNSNILRTKLEYQFYVPSYI